MNTKAFLVLLLSIGWIWFCQHWHCCWINQYCSTGAPVTVVTPPPIKDAGPLSFKYSSSEPILSQEYNTYADDTFLEMTEDNILEITGAYYENEATPEGFDNMGMARADAIRNLLALRISGERVRLKSKLSQENQKTVGNSFIGHSFSWIIPEIDKSEVVELVDKTVILFPFNSASNKTDPNVDNYLSNLAERLKLSGELVHLTGHTDAIGTEKYNQRLGLKRARKIRRILINKGVKRAQIKIYSKGMSEPVATNNTDEGRTQNRRVVVRTE